jgi:hypothetical protein
VGSVRPSSPAFASSSSVSMPVPLLALFSPFGNRRPPAIPATHRSPRPRPRTHQTRSLSSSPCRSPHPNRPESRTGRTTTTTRPDRSLLGQSWWSPPRTARVRDVRTCTYARVRSPARPPAIYYLAGAPWPCHHRAHTSSSSSRLHCWEPGSRSIEEGRLAGRSPAACMAAAAIVAARHSRIAV